MQKLKTERMINMKKKPTHRIDYNNPLYNQNAAASMTECTGLAPTPITNQAQRDALGEIFEFFPEDIVEKSRK